eukprot:Rhum_TRINITY_DN10637_c0_g1::Rhum_TRINITY_DN10637_c0_g1_i1::g.39218::m.39218
MKDTSYIRDLETTKRERVRERANAHSLLDPPNLPQPSHHHDVRRGSVVVAVLRRVVLRGGHVRRRLHVRAASPDDAQRRAKRLRLLRHLPGVDRRSQGRRLREAGGGAVREVRRGDGGVRTRRGRLGVGDAAWLREAAGGHKRRVAGAQRGRVDAGVQLRATALERAHGRAHGEGLHAGRAVLEHPRHRLPPLRRARRRVRVAVHGRARRRRALSGVSGVRPGRRRAQLRVVVLRRLAVRALRVALLRWAGRAGHGGGGDAAATGGGGAAGCVHAVCPLQKFLVRAVGGGRQAVVHLQGSAACLRRGCRSGGRVGGGGADGRVALLELHVGAVRGDGDGAVLENAGVGVVHPALRLPVLLAAGLQILAAGQVQVPHRKGGARRSGVGRSQRGGELVAPLVRLVAGVHLEGQRQVRDVRLREGHRRRVLRVPDGLVALHEHRHHLHVGLRGLDYGTDVRQEGAPAYLAVALHQVQASLRDDGVPGRVRPVFLLLRHAAAPVHLAAVLKELPHGLGHLTRQTALGELVSHDCCQCCCCAANEVQIL